MPIRPPRASPTSARLVTAQRFSRARRRAATRRRAFVVRSAADFAAAHFALATGRGVRLVAASAGPAT